MEEKNNKIQKDFLPREKLLKYNSPDKLIDDELLAIILRVGTKNYNILKLAKNFNITTW